MVYLSDEILFPCARARLLHELRWLCVLCLDCSLSIHLFVPFFVHLFFNVISLSRWKIFMANGSTFYTHQMVIAKSCSKQITFTNSGIGLCCWCVFFISSDFSSCHFAFFFNQTFLKRIYLNIPARTKCFGFFIVFFFSCSNWLRMDRKSFEHKKPIKICKMNILWETLIGSR